MPNVSRRFGLKPTGHLAIAALAIAAGVGIGGQARGAPVTTSWQATVGPVYSGTFSDPAHWTAGVPNNNDPVSSPYTTYFNNSGQTYTVTFTGAAATTSLYLYSGNGTFALGGNTFTMGAGTGTRVVNGTWAFSNGTVASQIAYTGIGGTSASVTLSGSTSHWTNTDSHIGYNSAGTISLSNGATGSTSGSLTFGDGTSGIGTLNLDNAQWTAAGLTYLGYGGSGAGTVNVTNGGNFSPSILSLARQAANTGSMSISGQNSKTVVTNYVGIGGYTDGGSTNTDGGTATLDIADGGSLSGKGMVVFDGGSVTLANGTISVGTSGAGTVNATRGGTFDISHRNDGTNIGNTINGNLTLGSTTATTVHLASDTDYANLDVSKTLTVAGTLNVVLDGAYSPTNGKTFDLFDWGQTGNLTSTFSNVDFSLAPLASGLSWDTTNLYTQGIIAVVPEPAALSLLAVGGLLALRRRRN
jgi:hypothetical protein